MATITEAETDPKTSPVYWFVVLQQAIDRGDFEAAAKAQRALADLGVQVVHQKRRARANRGTRRGV
jgi:uncharacterized protein YPO0396